MTWVIHRCDISCQKYSKRKFPSTREILFTDSGMLSNLLCQLFIFVPHVIFFFKNICISSTKENFSETAYTLLPFYCYFLTKCTFFWYTYIARKIPLTKKIKALSFSFKFGFWHRKTNSPERFFSERARLLTSCALSFVFSVIFSFAVLDYVWMYMNWCSNVYILLLHTRVSKCTYTLVFFVGFSFAVLDFVYTHIWIYIPEFTIHEFTILCMHIYKYV